MVLEYDGGRYHGSQIQVNTPTIQSEVEEALFRLTGEKIRLKAASRTDAGVHARGQVVSFETASGLESPVFVKGLNYHLPLDIAVKAVAKVKEGFDPRRNAISRCYSYFVLNSEAPSPIGRYFCYQVSSELDIEAMNRACRVLVGEHDFSSFASDMAGIKKSPIRRIYEAVIERKGDTVVFRIMANAFLPHQVRNTVGSLIRVGLNRMTFNEFNSIMKAREFGLAGPAAPPYGLFLEKVNYAEGVLEWETV